MKQTMSFQTSLKQAGGSASNEALAQINQYALEPQTRDSVYVRTAYAGHNAIDRDGDVIDAALLHDIARTLPGKGFHIRHPIGADGDSGPGVGRVFEAKVVEKSHDEARLELWEPNLRFPDSDQPALLLEVSFYIPRTDKNEHLITDMDAGVAGDVSLGFRHGQRTEIFDVNGNKVADRLNSPGEGYELSLVWLGAQPGARVHKAMGGTNVTPSYQELLDENTKLKRQVEVLVQKNMRLIELLPAGGRPTNNKALPVWMGGTLKPNLSSPTSIPPGEVSPLCNPAIG